VKYPSEGAEFDYALGPVRERLLDLLKDRVGHGLRNLAGFNPEISRIVSSSWTTWEVRSATGARVRSPLPD